MGEPTGLGDALAKMEKYQKNEVQIKTSLKYILRKLEGKECLYIYIFFFFAINRILFCKPPTISIAPEIVEELFKLQAIQTILGTANKNEKNSEISHNSIRIINIMIEDGLILCYRCFFLDPIHEALLIEYYFILKKKMKREEPF